MGADQRLDIRAALHSLAWVVVVVALATPAAAQTKYAFVVGIDRYDNLPAAAQLRKAVGDARAVGKTLAALGHKVTSVIEPTRGQFIASWYQFLDQVRPGDTIAFVFSGHGVELEGSNFLLPRDVPRVRSGREGQLRSESLSFGQLLTDMRERQPAFSFVVLDACRDNPFDEGGRTVGGRRGLGRVDALEGTFVMFSAGAGQTALDRLDDADGTDTSVFTRTLLPLMRKPGLSLLDMADQVGEQVQSLARTVGHNQTPAFYSRVIGGRHVCLAGCDASLPREAASRAAEVIIICREVEKVTSMTTLGVLRRQYQGTPAAECILARIDELQVRREVAHQTKVDAGNHAPQAPQVDPKAIIESAVKALRDADLESARKADKEAQANADAVRRRLVAQPKEINSDPACLTAPSDAWEVVIRSCSKYIAENPSKRLLERALNRRGLAYTRAQLHEEALTDFNRLIGMETTNSGYFDNRQSVLRNLKRYNLALRDANETVRLSPGVAFGYHARGNLYADMGQYENAVVDLTRASTTKDAFIWSIYDRGRAYTKLGRPELAVQDFTNVIGQEPNSSWPYRERALAKITLGALDDARNDLKIFLDREPNEPGATKALAILGGHR
jgi:tetratricopeptide (TPR) repeat protein